MKKILWKILIAIQFIYLLYLIKKNKELQKVYSEKVRQFNMALDCLLIMGNKEVFSNWLVNNGYNNVGIYGMGALGKILYQMLRQMNNDGIVVRAIIDKALINETVDSIVISAPETNVDNIDLLVVTPYSQYEEIREQMEKRTYARIISIRDLIIYIKREMTK